MLSNVISSQGIHDAYGGVVPEIASRHHLELVNAAVDDALRRAGATLDDIGLVGVTQGPGLVGALLVGVATAKGIAAARGLPLAPVDHLQGHVAANFLRAGAGGDSPESVYSRVRRITPSILEPPFVCLLASGGHTLLARVEDHATFDVLGRTLDDAAGEAFDKGARLLGLPFPGGPALEKLARDGDPHAFAFPVARGLDGLDFSFAGVKTSLLYRVRDLGPEAAAARRGADLAASYQHAIVEALAERCERALDRDRRATAWRSAEASPPTARCARACRRLASRSGIPPRELCTDNAAMIASAARFATGPPVSGLPRARRLRLGRARARMSGLVLYSRPGCHLCDDARAVIERVGAPFAEIDIETDDALHAAYLERIPVVALDGVELFEYFVDEGALRVHLDRVSHSMTPGDSVLSKTSRPPEPAIRATVCSSAASGCRSAWPRACRATCRCSRRPRRWARRRSPRAS